MAHCYLTIASLDEDCRKAALNSLQEMIRRGPDQGFSLDLFKLSLDLGSLCLGDRAGRVVVERQFPSIEKGFCQFHHAHEVESKSKLATQAEIEEWNKPSSAFSR